MTAAITTTDTDRLAPAGFAENEERKFLIWSHTVEFSVGGALTARTQAFGLRASKVEFSTVVNDGSAISVANVALL